MNVIVVGAGFAGLSAASFLAKQGFNVTVLEKNSTPGGRARRFSEKGFTFDMGPSWYWMPDVFESYFKKFNKKVSDYYQLTRLDPSYKVVFGDNEQLTIPADYNKLKQLFESIEPGSGPQLDKFLKQAEYKYEAGIGKLVYKPGRSVTEFLSLKLLFDLLRLDIFSSIHTHVRKFFRDKKLIQLMEFPILFLGALAKNTPALYSMMNYADIKLGTWYPENGMNSVVDAMVKLNEELGVKFIYDADVKNVNIEDNHVTTVRTGNSSYNCDILVAGSDYHHFDTLLPKKFRNYSDQYWEKRTMAPSSLIFYLGLNKKLPQLDHHTLFFDADFSIHADEIYTHPKWPSKPLYYLSVPSKTDPKVAPEGCENIFILIPVAPGLEDTEETREYYFRKIMDRFEDHLGEKIRENIIFKRYYAHKDFINDYNSFKGNAYGLANTLTQTAILKPSLKNKKLKNLYYTGQLTVPGPGVPPSLISGEVVAKEIVKDLKIA